MQEQERGSLLLELCRRDQEIGSLACDTEARADQSELVAESRQVSELIELIEALGWEWAEEFLPA